MNQDAPDPATSDSAATDSAVPVPAPNESSDPSVESIRAGSPFAVDPEPALPEPKFIETFYDVGPMRYTAMGAVAAAVMVFGFGAVAASWFPSGGVLIAALGCGLSLFGLASTYRITSIGLLVANLGLFLFCYSRSLA